MSHAAIMYAAIAADELTLYDEIPTGRAVCSDSSRVPSRYGIALKVPRLTHLHPWDNTS